MEGDKHANDTGVSCTSLEEEDADDEADDNAAEDDNGTDAGDVDAILAGRAWIATDCVCTRPTSSPVTRSVDECWKCSACTSQLATSAGEVGQCSCAARDKYV